MRPFLAPLAVLVLAGCTSMGPAAPVPARAVAPTTVAAKPDPAAVKALEDTLRSLLRKNLPDPIVQSAPGWGQQKAIDGDRLGPRFRGLKAGAMANDGHWKRMSIKAAKPDQTLALGITEAAFPEPGRATFTASIGADCDFKFEQQVWKNGLRLYSGETRGRCRGAVLLKCESTSRTETKPGSFLPDLVFRMRVTEAQLFYENVVIEHTAGVGGDAAKLLGEAFLDTVKRVKPDLERDLLAKANAAIVKAADTKEVRLSVDGLRK